MPDEKVVTKEICDLRKQNITLMINDVEKRLLAAIEKSEEVIKLADEGRAKALSEALLSVSKNFQELKTRVEMIDGKLKETLDASCIRCRQMVDACKEAEIGKFESFEKDLRHLREDFENCKIEVKEKEFKALDKKITDQYEEKIKPLEETCADIDKFINKYKYIVIGVLIAAGVFGHDALNWLINIIKM